MNDIPSPASDDPARQTLQLPAVILTDRRLNLNDLRVLMALYLFADPTGRSSPTRDTLASLTGLPASRISTTTSRLAGMGWLEKTSGSGKSTTQYQLPTPGQRPPGLPSRDAADPDELRSRIQDIVKEELTRLNGAGHLAGRDISPEQRLNLKRFRKPSST
ncbi:MAG: helix-turn-helix domain-containing protein [Magnetococcales bacterium]|nr:helix-turn-helix domain-containing protein [Magnetococcales bacterium]